MSITVENRINHVGGNFNGNMNSGNNVTQTNIWGDHQNNTFNKFIEEIKVNPSLTSQEVADSVEILEDLKDKKCKGSLKPSILERMWSALPVAVQTIGIAAEVYKIFSIS